jgi:excisionase family DNA binding protein
VKTTLEAEDVQEIAKSVCAMLKPLIAQSPALPNNLMNIDDLCAYLKVSKQWVYERTHLKQIPYIKLSNKELRFRKKDIDLWLDSLKTPQVNEYKKMTFFMVA